MTPNHVDDAEHWRERTAQMRVLATTMKQIGVQAIMARLAEDYDNLADRAELRANGEVPQEAGRPDKLAASGVAIDGWMAGMYPRRPYSIRSSSGSAWVMPAFPMGC